MAGGDDTKHKLLATKNLTLKDAIDLCRSEEAATQTKTGITPTNQVNAVRRSTYQKQKSEVGPKPGETRDNSVSKCPNCGRSRHVKNKCPAADRTCNGCHRTGHFQSMCPHAKKTKPTNKVGNLKLQRAGSRRDMAVPVMTKIDKQDQPRTLLWTPDTGSDIDAIGSSHLQLLGGSATDLEYDPDVVNTANGNPLVNLGKTQATLISGSTQLATTLHVYEGLDEALLSCSSLRALGFLPADWPKNMLALTATPSPDKIEKVQSELLREYSDVFQDTMLKPMKGPKMDIELEPTARPSCVHAARTIPFAYRAQVKTQLDEMIREGVIEPVSEASKWCHPIVTVKKRDSNERRLTVDLRRLNDQVCRPTHPVVTARDAIGSIEKACYFTKLDARHGYWQIPLSDEAKPLTTFITQWGRFRFCRNPQGLISAGDEFNRRTDAAFDHLPNLIKVVDDCLVYDTDFESHVNHVRDVLQRARAHGITLSPKKFVFGVSAVDFCGYRVSSEGWTVDAEKTSAIREFPIPANITDLRSFFGLVNQCNEFCPKIAELSQPLRPLLKPSNEFVWDQCHTEAFDSIRSALTSPPVLAYFKLDQPIRLETDASALNGLGFALWQHQDNHWRLLQCGSRFLTDTESRYAIIELECLAVVWAAHKCALYLSGTRFEVVTDHRPLIPILNSYSLDQIENPRLQRLVLKLRCFQLQARWQPGSKQAFADALSRHPVANPTSADELGEDQSSTLAAICACTHEDPSGKSLDLGLEEVRSEAQHDTDYRRLTDCILTGFPKSQSALPDSLKVYWNGREHLTVENGIILKGQKILIPKSLQSRVLSDLHASHQGITRTKRRARQIVFWPNISRDIEHFVRNCPECRLHHSSQCKEPLLVENRRPELPFQSTSADLFECQGLQFLVYVDRKTGWPCINKIGSTATSADVIRCLRRWFPDVGAPQILTTDGGPQFASHKFTQFCSNWQIQHVRSSPHYPQSNGHAEAAVKAMKLLISKTTRNGNLDIDEFQRGLLEWRNTPRGNGQSPAQALFGRPLGSFLFAHRSSFAQEWQRSADDIDQVTLQCAEKAKEHYDSSARPLPRLSMGTHVDIQDSRTKLWSSHGIIVAIGNNRDYMVKLPSGRIYWRNRRFLRARVSPVPITSDPARPMLTTPAEDPPPPSTPPNEPPGLDPPPGSHRTSRRQRKQNVPFNIICTRGQSYD